LTLIPGHEDEHELADEPELPFIINLGEHDRSDQWLLPEYVPDSRRSGYGALTRGGYAAERQTQQSRRDSFVRICENSHCMKWRDYDDSGELERFIDGRCPPCYEWRRTHDGEERPWPVVCEYRDRLRRREAEAKTVKYRAARAAERKAALAAVDAELREEGRCVNGHQVDPDELDRAGRCKSCKKSRYKTGVERAFDYNAFLLTTADEADDWVEDEWFREPAPEVAEQRVRDELADENAVLAARYDELDDDD